MKEIISASGRKLMPVLKKSPYLLGALALLLLAYLAGSWHGQKGAGRAGSLGERRILHYVDPMNPAHTSPEPGLAPCGMMMEPVYADGEGQDTLHLAPGAVKISPQKQQLIGVRIGEVEKAPYTHTLRALGRVAVDETRIYRLNSFVDGWILKTYNNSTNSLVMKDETLASFYSRDFLTAEQAYLYQLSALDRFRKGDQMIDSQLIGLTSQIRGAEENLQNLGMSKVQIEELARTRRLTQDINIVAPATSFVLTRNVSVGQKISRNDDLYKLADLSHVWILADLYENEAKYLRPGLKVRASLPNQNKTLWATVSDVLPAFDATTRTLKLRLEADNPEYALRPDMFVDLEFPLTLPETVMVPAEAVMGCGLKQMVFIDRGNGNFEPRKVEIGWRLDDRVEILKGLTPGEKIAISGNFLIDSESRMKLAARGISGEATKDPVCGLNVDGTKAKAAGHQSNYKNETYYFCSEDCQQHFNKYPERYAVKPVSTQEAAGDPPPESSANGPTAPPRPITAKDPVCGLEVDPGYATALGLTREFEGKTYYFRQADSLQKFDKDPKGCLTAPVSAPAPAPPGQPPAAGAEVGKLKEELVYGGQEHYLVKAFELDRPLNLPETLKETPVTDQDPVCGMKLGVDVVKGLAYKTPYQGKLYFFCSDQCKQEFDRKPEYFVNKLASLPISPALPIDVPKEAASVPAPVPGPVQPQAEHVHPGQMTPPGPGQGNSDPDKDPVCGADLKMGGLRASFPKTTYQGKVHYFCSDKCKTEFDKDPARYQPKPAQEAMAAPPAAPSNMPKLDARGRPLPGPLPPDMAAPAAPGTGGR